MEYTVIDKYLARILDESTPETPVWKNAQKPAPAADAVEQPEGTPVEQSAPKLGKNDGAMTAALYSLYRRTGDRKYLNYLDGYLGYFVAEDGTILGYEPEESEISAVEAGRTLFDLYRETGNVKYKKAIDVLYNQLMRQPRTQSGTFAHSKSCPDKVRLCEASEIFYTRYETEFNRGRNYADIVRQYKDVYERLYDAESKLFKASWNGEEVSDKVCLRAIGRFLSGLADVISYFDMSEPDLKAELITTFRRTVEGLESYVDKDKHMLWLNPANVEEEGNYPETSGSAYIAYAMLKGARLGYADRRFAKVGESIFNAICGEYLKETDDGFELGGIRPDGEDSAAVINDENGVVALIAAYSEIKALRH